MAYPQEQKTHYTFQAYTQPDEGSEFPVVLPDRQPADVFCPHLRTGRGEVEVPHRRRVGGYRGAAATGAYPAHEKHVRGGCLPTTPGRVKPFYISNICPLHVPAAGKNAGGCGKNGSVAPVNEAFTRVNETVAPVNEAALLINDRYAQ